jgi:2-methylcitrate dehydratase
MKKAAIWVLCSRVVVSLVVVAVSLIGLGPVAAQQAKVGGPPTNTAAWALARYAVALKYEDLPADVVAITKRHILDTVGVALGAYTAPSIGVIRDVIMTEGGTPESTVLGSGQKTSVVNATVINGSMIRYLDFMDTYWSDKAYGYMHPCNSIAEALSMAERQHASGKDLIVATVLAYEIQSRLVDTFVFPHISQHTGAGFTAPVVAGKLLGLNAEQMANAIGIAGSRNFTIEGVYGIGFVSDMKEYGYAAGSGNGVMAALLAQKGLTGPVTIIESYQKGFEKNQSLDPLIAPRKEFKISQAWMKPYEANHVSHSAIAGVIQIVTEHNIKPDQVEKVDVRGLPTQPEGVEPLRFLTQGTFGAIRYKNDADHNLAYLLSMAILDHEVGPDQFDKEQWKDPKVQELMSKMEFKGDMELVKDFPRLWTCIVQITTKDKQVYTQRVDLPKGGPKNPFTDKELEAKFSKLVTKLMPQAQADQIIKTIYDLDKLDDVSGLMKLLIVAKK